MPLRTDQYYRDLAQAALSAAKIDEPPVPVDAVVRATGIPIYCTKFPAWFSGAIVYEDGMPVILLNNVIEEIDKRRTLGHLLGHILVVLDDPSAGYPRRDDDHRAADVISEELVVPGSLVADQARKWFNDYRYLARLFGVTEIEMMDKMRDLGIIRARGITWDY